MQLGSKSVEALIDTGSSASFMNKSLAKHLKLLILPASGKVSMASSSQTANILGEVIVDFYIGNKYYSGIILSVLNNLCKDVILGQDFMQHHKSIKFEFNGTLPPLKVCALAALTDVEPPSLFNNLTPDCKPVRIKSRRYCSADIKFIKSETERLIKNGVIEESVSPWRSQVLITSSENHKRRMVIDYSHTINRFTERCLSIA